MSELRAVAPNGGANVSESNYFEKNFQQAYWGSNYDPLDQEENTILQDCSSFTMEYGLRSGAPTASLSSDSLC